jgi:hypothetical protein
LFLLHLSMILQVVHYVPKLVLDLKNQAYAQKCFKNTKLTIRGALLCPIPQQIFWILFNQCPFGYFDT